MKKLFNALLVGGCLCFLTAVSLLGAYVYDCEPVSPEKEYSLEREVFNRTNDDWNKEFPSFSEWLGEREERQDRFNEWVAEVGKEFAREYAASVDPAYAREKDTSVGQAGEEPDGRWDAWKD